MIATFMPKPFTRPDGQRLPLPHVALGRRHEPLPRRGRPARARPLGARPTTSSAGSKTHARAYERADRADRELVQAAEGRARPRAARRGRPSGSRTATTTARRCCASRARDAIEDRTIDGSCNPYLAAAAVLAAGLDGIENGLDAGEPNAENLYAIALRGAHGTRARDAAGEPARGDGRARAGRRAAGGARARPGRGLRRLLHRA